MPKYMVLYRESGATSPRAAFMNDFNYVTEFRRVLKSVGGYTFDVYMWTGSRYKFYFNWKE